MVLNAFTVFICFAMAVRSVHNIPAIIALTGVYVGLTFAIVKLINKYSGEQARNTLVIESHNGWSIRFTGRDEQGLLFKRDLESECYDNYQYMKIWSRYDFDHSYGWSFGGERGSCQTIVEVAHKVEECTGIKVDLTIKTWEEFFG
jgi:hypothetical protein